MKALFFDAGDLGKTVRDGRRSPPRTCDEAKQYREQLFDVLTQHDDKDLITSRRARGQGPRPGEGPATRPRADARAADLAGARRLRPRAHRHSAAARRGDVLPAQPARPAAGRRARTRRSGQGGEAQARPEGAVLRAGVQGRVAPERATGSSSASTPARCRPNRRAYNPGKDVKENIAKLFHVHADPNRGLEEVETGPGRRHRRASSA